MSDDGWVDVPSSTASNDDGWTDVPTRSKADNGIVGSVEYDTSHRAEDAPAGPLTRTEDDGWMSGAAKGATTAAMRGVAGIPGMIGNTRDFGRYLADRALHGMGNSQEQIDENRRNHSSYIDDALDWVGDKTGLRPRFPNTDTFAAPVEEHTGRYDPETQIGRISQGVLEAGISGMGPQGAVIKARPNGFMRPPVNAADAPRAAGMEALSAPVDKKLAALNAGAATIGNTVSEFTGDPLYGFGANVLAGPAMHMTGAGAKKLAGPAWARFSPEFRDQSAAEQLRGYATNPDKFTDSVLNRPDKDRILPDSPLTTGQAHGDAGVLEAERQFRADDDFKHRINAQEAEQNDARVKALRDIPSDAASSSELVRSIEERHNAITERYNQAEEKLRADAERKAAELGDQADPMEIGAKLREEIQTVRAKEQAEISKIYDAVDPNGDLRLLTSPIQEGLGEIESRENRFTKYTKEAQELIDEAKEIPEVMSLKDLRGLDTRLSGVMSAERRAAGETESWSVLKVLKGKVKDSINNAIEHQLAWEKAAGIKPEDGLEGRFRQNDSGTGVSETEGDAVTGARTATVGEAGQSGEMAVGPALGEARTQDGGPRDVGSGPGLAEEAGRDHTIYYSGGNLTAKYQIVDLGDLITSHDLDLRQNPKYPQELQPRDRSAGNSFDQIRHITNELNPEQLGKSAEANTGAPIVGPDGVVESGNGRTISIAKNYAAGDPRGYRAWLESQGFDVAGMKNPVLIARRTSEMSPAQREFFTSSTATNTGLNMNASERAALDAKYLTPDVMFKLKDGPIDSVDNAEFVLSFMNKMPVNERGSFRGKDNQLSITGVDRLKAAIVSAAFGDAAIIERAFVDTDNNVKNITGALTDVAGSWAKMRAAAKDGDIAPEHDVTSQLLDTIKKVMKARDEKRPLQEAIPQKDIFAGDTPAVVEDLIIKNGKVVSRKQIANNLESYAKDALNNKSGGLFESDVTPENIIKIVSEKEQLPPEEEAVGETEAPKKPEQGTFEAGAGQSNLPKPNMTQESADNLSTANKRYGEYAQTYRKGEVGSILKTEGFANQYKVRDSAVAARAIKPNDTGYETASAFFKASKDSPGSVEAMKEMLLNHFRKAVGDDGILNSNNYSKLVKKYDGVIRAIEERSPGFMKDVADARKASDMLDTFTVRRKEALDTLKKEAAGRFMGLRDDADIAKEAGILIDGSGASVQKIRSIVKDLTPDAKDGLQRAAVDWMLTKKTNATNSGLENSEFVLSKRFSKMLKEKRAIMEELFTPEQMGVMDAISEDMAAAERSVLATKDRTNPSGSARSAKQHIEEAVTEVGNKSFYAIALSSLMSSYESAGPLGVLKMAPFMIIGETAKSARAKGKASINDVVKQAILDPVFARELLKKVPAKESQIYASNAGLREKSIKGLFNSLFDSFYRTNIAFPSMAEVDHQSERLKRKSGGRIGRAMTVDEVIAGMKLSQKRCQQRTQSILDKPDEVVVRALNIADQHI